MIYCSSFWYTKSKA